ncbi:MAG TPA: branched-chain amino acid ABC transporter ATP-binding protein/permease [Streptosporangiaceae bacterium]|nr:branched-chain amino acid ABC transporter ATP-binding protein/permease [Streptosporangiaceae bacterium]HLN71350.1 branched-chain amino acid ABC transporter ATP-binding protein/permease [Streptosporangiaceae bacterium]
MTSAQLYYLLNLLIYAGVDIIACLGLSQQFGVAGVTNFGFIIFQAVGAYTAAILSLPSQSANGGFQSYLGGWNLPFPVPWIGAAIVGGLAALPFTFLVGRRLRGDFAAVGLLVTAVTFNLLVTNYRPFLNGAAGLSLVPAPLQGEYDPSGAGYQWAYAVIALVLAAGAYWLVRRVTESPYGRSLRAMRDNDLVADSLGKNLLAQRTSVLVLGGALAGLSGGILVGYITTWSPGAWGYAETIVLFAAVIIGGAGSHRGAVLGAILVPVGFEEATRYIPSTFGPPGFVDDLQWVAIGLLVVIFLWFRPQGILPERRRIIGAASAPVNMTNEDVVTLAGPVRASHGAAVAGSALPAADPASRATASPAVADDGAVLRAVDLVRDFGGVHAVAGVSIEVRRGTLTGLIGPNGAGKSTLLSVLAGTIPVTSGQVIYQGRDVTGLPAYRRARLGLVRTFQLASEFKRLTVMENLLSAVPGHRGDSLAGALRGRRFWRRDEEAAIARARVLLERFGLSSYADTYGGDLSGGQRRLTEIMRALMTEPAMLLLDEPMAGVHPRLARQIGAQLLDLCAEGMTILMVEHELAIMDEFCNPVIMMAEGTVLATGTMTDLRARAEVVEAYLVG